MAPFLFHSERIELILSLNSLRIVGISSILAFLAFFTSLLKLVASSNQCNNASCFTA